MVSKPYRATITQNGKTVVLGMFATAEEAGRRYDQEARRLNGGNNLFNFPEPGERGLDGTVRLSESVPA